MKARDLKPLPNPIPVREGGKILDRLNDLLAIVQQMEDRAESLPSPELRTVNGGYQPSATLDVMQALKDVIDRHLEMSGQTAGQMVRGNQLVPWVADACMAKRLHRLFAAAKAADVWPHAAVGAD